MKLGLVFNAAQAKVFIKKGVKPDRLLSFCPEAKYYLDKENYNIITSLELYGPHLHAKTAAITIRDLDKVTEECKQFYDLRYGESRSLRVYLYYFLSTAYYVYYCLAKVQRQYSEYCWEEGGKIHSTTDFGEFCFRVINQAASEINLYSKTDYTYFNYRIAKWLNKKLVAKTAVNSTIRLVDFTNPATRHIVKALVDRSATHVSYSLRRMGVMAFRTFTIYLKTCFWLKKENIQLNEPVPLFKAINPRKFRVYKNNIPTISIRNPHMRRVVLDNIIRFIPVLRAEYDFGMEVIRLIDANINIGDHAMYPFIRGTIEQMHLNNGEHNISVLVNHGTHNLNKSHPVSDLVQRSWGGQDRLVTELTTIFIPKSPLTLALAKDMYPDFNYEMRPVRLYDETLQTPYDGKEDFIIIHAGNYTDVYTRIGWLHIPWCRETSFEYLSQSLEFLEQIKDVDGIKVIMKLKPFKFDPHYQVIKEHIDRLGIGHKVVLDTGVGFSKLVKKCHMVVSNLSTTMEESVPANIPTLLYTYRKKYFHFPCSHTPAAEGHYPLIYGAKSKNDVAPMIKAIMKHYDMLLKQRNKGIAWQKEDILGVEPFIDEVCALVAQRNAALKQAG